VWLCCLRPARTIDQDVKERIKAYRLDKKFDAASNDRVRQLALIDSIKAYVDKEVYDEVNAVCSGSGLAGRAWVGRRWGGGSWGCQGKGSCFGHPPPTLP
jgi:hypothetical protein